MRTINGNHGSSGYVRVNGNYTDINHAVRLNLNGFLQERWFEANVVSTPRQANGTNPFNVTVGDSVYTRYTNPGVYSDALCQVSRRAMVLSEITFGSSNPSVFTVNGTGRIACVASGVANLSLLSSARNLTIPLVMSAVGDTTFDTYVGGATGSVRKWTEERFAALLAGRNPETDKPIFSTQNHANGVYIRNTSCWAYPLRQTLTCASPWNSYGGPRQAGTLITPDVVFGAAHYWPPEGVTFRFVTADNVIVERQSMHNWADFNHDFAMAKLNAPVPNTISVAKVLPDNWVTKITGSGKGLPVLATDQEEKALLMEVKYIDLADPNPDYHETELRTPQEATRYSFFEQIISGDSGNPCGLIINDSLILLMTFFGPMDAYSETGHKALLRSGLAALGSAYDLSEIDLSGFTSFT